MKTATKKQERKSSTPTQVVRPKLYPIPRPGRQQLGLLIVAAAMLGGWLSALVWLAWRSS